MENVEQVCHDVLVIGGGIAGLRAAVQAIDAGSNVGLVSKVHPLRSQSGMANSVNSAFRAGDSWESHAYDTVKGSDWLGDQTAIKVLCKNGVNDVLELEKFGVLYNRDKDGDYVKKPEGSGGQSFPRSTSVTDYTGHFILLSLFQKAMSSNQMTLYDEWFISTLLQDESGDRIGGALGFDLAGGKLWLFKAKSVILCTGGCGQVYQRTTNALPVTGDGMVLALNQGVPLEDMEFIQFHPTGLANSTILMSEGCRTVGAYLINDLGERFMSKYAKDRLELAPRDIVARGIQQEILEGRGIGGKSYVYLDLRHVGKEKILKYLPKGRDLAITFAGVDMIQDPVPVTPSQHYSMGGIETDINGATRLKGLYAAGECACVSVHGANRLGGNSLLDVIVFAKIAASDASKYASNANEPKLNSSIVNEEIQRLSSISTREGGSNPWPLINTIKETISKCAGMSRTKEGLSEALEIIKNVRDESGKVGVKKQRYWCGELANCLELLNLTTIAEAICTSAILREESRGSHYRLDYPKRDDNTWLRHSMLFKDHDDYRISYKPVDIQEWPPGERKY